MTQHSSPLCVVEGCERHATLVPVVSLKLKGLGRRGRIQVAMHAAMVCERHGAELRRLHGGAITSTQQGKLLSILSVSDIEESQLAAAVDLTTLKVDTMRVDHSDHA